MNSLPGPLNMPQLFLFCALDVERHLPEFDRRTGRPGPVASHAAVAALPAVEGSPASEAWDPSEKPLAAVPGCG